MAVATDPAPPSPPARPGMTAGDAVRLVLRGIGQTLITLGLVVLLFVVYEVWITNLSSQRANRRLVAKIQQEWQRGDDPLLPLPNGTQPSIKGGTGIADLYIPRLGRDYHFGVVEGVDADDLAVGPGHYPGTALPGVVGNFAVAGHRVGKGEPFLNIDQLRTGDPIIVETKSSWFVYRVLGSPAGQDPQTARAQVPVRDGAPVTVPGREIVDPSDGDVLLPVPDHAGAQPLARLMTMTTCHTKFTATHRMIVYSVLQTKVPHSGDAMPASISALYDGES